MKGRRLLQRLSKNVVAHKKRCDCVISFSSYNKAKLVFLFVLNVVLLLFGCA